MNKLEVSNVFVVGFALFAMFFGAGNLIIPSFIGLQAGTGWYQALGGFGLSGIGLPLLGIMAMAKNEGSLEKFAGKVNHKFSVVFGTLVILCIGPLLAIPRTGAATYEVGVQPIFPGISPLVSSLIYFSLTLYFSINKSKVIDTIGKILTPILLLVLGIIFFKGIFYPLGEAVGTGIDNPFKMSFFEGYQTMDALASIIFAGIIIENIKSRGYKKPKEQVKLTVISGGIAALGLLLVYGGLMYLGATVSGQVPNNIDRAELLISITSSLLGSWGKIPLGIAVSLACLTTSIGLTAATGNFFNYITNERLSYKAVVIVTTVLSLVISNFGVDNIMRFSAPVLVALYPVVIVLITMNLFGDFIKNESVYTTTVLGTLLISLFDGLEAAKISTGIFGDIIAKIPLAKSGLAWILPAIAGFLIGVVFFNKKEVSKRENLKPIL